MRLFFLPLLAAASVSASAVFSPPDPAPRSAQDCADRITEVRDAAGQPRLDRTPGRPGEGYLIAAVDKRIDGCAVMQMHRRVDDLRPVPQPTAGPARLIPLR